MHQKVHKLYTWDLPEKFLSAVAAEDVDIPDRKSFAIRLGATKIGQSSAWEKFLNKMARLQSVIPFATIRYIAIIIPPQLVEKGLTAKQGEGHSISSCVVSVHSDFARYPSRNFKILRSITKKTTTIMTTHIY